MNTLLKRPELLIPVGGREQLNSALLYGADAVFLSGREFSLRAKCDAFDREGLRQAVMDAHAKDVKVFYCLNAMPYNNQLAELEEALESLPETGIDAFIIADPGVLWLARKHCPDMEIHLSTQAHSVNKAAVHFWQEYGVSRINLARELGEKDMSEIIREFPNMDFEIFVHGAMCLALSGHCLMSAWANGRSANMGLCTQPCRFKYRGVEATDIRLTLEESIRPGQAFLEVEQSDRHSAIFAPSDLCLVRHMESLLRMNPASLKIEGRTKSPSYVAQVTDVYRTALDYTAYKLGIEPKNSAVKNREFTSDDFVQELFHSSARPPRPLSSGFYFDERYEEKVPEDFVARPIVALLGKKCGDNSYEVIIRSTWFSEKDASFLIPGMERPLMASGRYSFTNHKGEKVDVLHPGMTGCIHLEEEISGLQEGLYIRA